MKNDFIKAFADAEYILIGIGQEWEAKKQPKVRQAYEALYELVKGKDYFVVTTLTDGEIFNSSFGGERVTAPCGNDTWKQCSKACTKDIWEEHEVLDGICPHCKEPLVGNTIKAETYIEEGYLPKWKEYTNWLSRTLNRKLLILELGEDFKTPTVIRWPFEKTAYINKQVVMFRIHQTYFQPSEEPSGRMVSIPEHSCEFFLNLF